MSRDIYVMQFTTSVDMYTRVCLCKCVYILLPCLSVRTLHTHAVVKVVVHTALQQSQLASHAAVKGLDRIER